MSWNGSENKGAQTAPKKTVKAPPSKWRGLAALAAVVIGGGLAAWLFIGGEKGETGEEVGVTPSKIVEVKPQIETNAVCSGEEVRSDVDEPPAPWKPRAQGVDRDKDGNIYLDGKKVRRATPVRTKQPYEIFRHRSENVIAGLISCEPGTMFFGSVRFNDRFVEDFEKSCREPIVVSEDDDEYVKNLKRDMNAIKIELKNRMNEGEDLAEILSETRNELQKMGRVKREIERMVRSEVRKNAQSEADVDAYVEAANKMLEARGIAPIKMNAVLRSNFARQSEKAAAEGGSAEAENDIPEKATKGNMQ